MKRTEDNNIERIYQRVGDVTGLSMITSEELQVSNYGMGGHYEPHFDFARREESKAFASLGTGNRIATWLFYVSDVDLGGATVFPSLDMTLWPKKVGEPKAAAYLSLSVSTIYFFSRDQQHFGTTFIEMAREMSLPGMLPAQFWLELNGSPTFGSTSSIKSFGGHVLSALLSNEQTQTFRQSTKQMPNFILS